MQVLLSISNSDRPRQNSWVSASGDYAKVTSDLIRYAKRDLNLTADEYAEIEALVQTWTPSNGYPLPKDEDHTRAFPCDGFTLMLTARSDERVKMIMREVDALFAKPDFSNHNPDALL